MGKRIGTVSIIITNREEQISKVNKIVSDHASIIIGRMGMPYPEKGINIISLIISGDTDEVGSLTGKLGSIKGVQVKSVLAKI